jgi:hypothetical protein
MTLDSEPDGTLADDQALSEAIGELTEHPADRHALVRVAERLSKSARAAGVGPVANGKWLADVLVQSAEHIKVRDIETLSRHHNGLGGAALAEEVVRNATRASAAVGAVSGALISAGQFAPPAWLAVPFELLLDTLVVAAIEVKLVAELHEVYGVSIPGNGQAKTMTLVRAWAERRGIDPRELLLQGGVSRQFGRTAREQLMKAVRRRLVRSMGRNLSALAPLFAGAVAGAEVNRRSTRGLGETVLNDLARRVLPG